MKLFINSLNELFFVQGYPNILPPLSSRKNAKANDRKARILYTLSIIDYK